MWIYANPNPEEQNVPDCVVRAISIALNMTWEQAYDAIVSVGRRVHNIPSADMVWGRYLYELGFEPVKLPDICPGCISVYRFTRMFPFGTYIIGTGNHAVAVIDGNYYDTWDSGNETVSFFWKISD